MKEDKDGTEAPQTKVMFQGRKVYVASPKIVGSRDSKQKQPCFEDEALVQKTDRYMNHSRQR